MLSKIGILELRNYLLKENSFQAFNTYFNTHFVAPQLTRGAILPGQFSIHGEPDHFFWLRGFEDMQNRLKFLRSFYDDSPEWRDLGAGANAMLVDSDQAHLLRRHRDPDLGEIGVPLSELPAHRPWLITDFHTANDGRIDSLTDAYKTRRSTLEATQPLHLSFWETEMGKSEFRHPVIQDPGLLVTILAYSVNNSLEEMEKRLQLYEQLGTSISSDISKKKITLLLQNQHPVSSIQHLASSPALPI